MCLVQYCFLKLPSALVSTNERFATAISACGDRAKLLHPPKHINHCPAIRHLTSREAGKAHLLDFEELAGWRNSEERAKTGMRSMHGKADGYPVPPPQLRPQLACADRGRRYIAWWRLALSAGGNRFLAVNCDRRHTGRSVHRLRSSCPG